jgi:hypothetical protein
MRDRRMADIEKDYKIALAKGKSEKEAQAKRDQRIADAKDDYAKRTGAGRTETRAAEKAAEARLSAARRSPDKDVKPVSVASEGPATKTVSVEPAKTPAVGKKSYDDMSFRAAFAQAMKDKGKGETFTWKGTSYKLETADSKKPTASARPTTPAKNNPPAPAKTPSADALALLMKRGTFPAPTKKADAKTPAAPKTPVKKADAKTPAATKTPAKIPPALAERGGMAPPVSTREPLRGWQAIAEHKRKAAQSRMPPPSDTAQNIAALRKLSGAGMAKGGKVKGYAKGGKIDGIAVRGKTKAGRKK